MTIAGVLRPAAALLTVLALAACAEPAGVGRSPDEPSSPAAAVPEDADALVFRVEHVGGFLPVEYAVSRVPGYSVYADGRLLTDGPVAAIYPGPALPNVQVARLEPGQVQELVERALAAGLADTTDLGTPAIADAATTRFTLTTADVTYVREVYALPGYWAPPGAHYPDDGLTEQQRGGREALAGLVGALEEVNQGAFKAASDAGTPPEEYEPAAMALIARPWVDPQDGLQQPTLDWPGPPLPGELVGGLADVGCSTVNGDQTPVLLAAARSGSSATPWRTADGSLWSVEFRPLLPDETGCADLTD